MAKPLTKLFLCYHCGKHIGQHEKCPYCGAESPYNHGPSLADPICVLPGIKWIDKWQDDWIKYRLRQAQYSWPREYLCQWVDGEVKISPRDE